MGPANTLDICYPIIYGGKQFVCDWVIIHLMRLIIWVPWWSF
jgi:hypothetical protein